MPKAEAVERRFRHCVRQNGLVTNNIGTALIDPGKPWQNGIAESFNGKFRDECLSLESVVGGLNRKRIPKDREL